MKIYKVVIVENTLPNTELYFTSFPSKDDVLNKLFYKFEIPRTFADYYFAISNSSWPDSIDEFGFIIVKYLNGICYNIRFQHIEVYQN